MPSADLQILDRPVQGKERIGPLPFGIFPQVLTNRLSHWPFLVDHLLFSKDGRSQGRDTEE